MLIKSKSKIMKYLARVFIETAGILPLFVFIENGFGVEMSLWDRVIVLMLVWVYMIAQSIPKELFRS